MHPRQLGGIVDRKLRHLVVPSLPIDFDERYERRVPADPTARPEPIRANTATLRRSLSPAERQEHLDGIQGVLDGKLTHLNETIRVTAPDEPDWFHPDLAEQPAFWTLQFHGFTFLEDVLFGVESPQDATIERQLVQRWIESWDRSDATAIGTKQYLRQAWTPHAVSLRVLNWCRYYSWCVERVDDPVFLRRLRRLIFKNALFLENHVEHEVGGNHLIENGIALVMAGILFRHEQDGLRWLETGVGILETAGDQFLPDGGHFEYSPMYHTIVLRRYLTALGLLEGVGSPWPTGLERTARSATEFLKTIRPPDGRIPLLNDAVYGEELELDSCLEYAHRVGIEPRPGDDRMSMPSSGYYWLGTGENRLLVDGGRFGPPHLPAHSHNDFFSFLLWVDGFPLVTDTGTYEYAPTRRRQQARSVRGHNTVQVGTAEPVDIGGRYLAGRRLNPQVSYEVTDGITSFDATYRKHGSNGYRHRRRIFDDSDWWLVRDSVTDGDGRQARSRLHLHPQVTVERRSNEGFVFSVDDTPLAYLLPVGFRSVARTTSPYFPEFGLEIRRPSLELVFSTDAESVGYLISKEPYTTADYRELEATAQGTVSSDEME